MICPDFSLIKPFRGPETKRKILLIVATTSIIVCTTTAIYKLTANFWEARKTAEIAAASQVLNKKVEDILDRFQQETARTHGVATMLGHNLQVIDVLRQDEARNNTVPPPPPSVPPWKGEANLQALNRYLEIAARAVSYEFIWVLNKQGRHIAASNAAELEDSGDVTFSDRMYFQESIVGDPGFQYAVGRQTNKPGFYFSSPVYDQGKIIGVLAIKVPISRFQRYVKNDQIIIADENGIIIAAHEPDMVSKSLDPVRLAELSDEALFAIYKQTNFTPLTMRLIDKSNQSEIMQVDEKPGYYLLAKGNLNPAGLNVYAYSHIDNLNEIKTDSRWVSLAMTAGGLVLVLLFIGIPFHLHRIGEDNKELVLRENKLIALNRQLDIQKKVAEQASRSKSEFIANMSHEIRTPLNGVLATTELLVQMNLDSLQKKYVDIIRSSGELLLVVINDILDLSKIEAGKVILHPVAINLRKKATVVIDLFAAQAKAKGLALRLHIDDEVPQRILVDQNRLSQILANLIGNAIKYTDQGSVDINISLCRKKAHPCIYIAITDTGYGVPKDKQEFIFEKFTQIQRKDTISGTGLGLPICKSLAEMMGGQIGMESDGVSGSTFWVGIPLVVAPDEVEGQDEHTEMQMTRADHAGCRVLVADDAEINLIVVAEMFRRLGCIVDTADDGKEAVEKTAKNTYDIIFMDCGMPVMDGYDATRAILANGNNKAPIIALTASVLSDEIEKCYSAGMKDLVLKPVSFDSLTRTLNKWHTGVVFGTSASADPPPKPKATEPPAFDPTILNDWRQTRADHLAKFIELILRDSAQAYAKIEQALAAHNAEALEESAEALETTANRIGGTALAAACLDLKTAETKDGFTEAHTKFAAVKTAYQAFTQALTDEKG